VQLLRQAAGADRYPFAVGTSARLIGPELPYAGTLRLMAGAGVAGLDRGSHSRRPRCLRIGVQQAHTLSGFTADGEQHRENLSFFPSTTTVEMAQMDCCTGAILSGGLRYITLTRIPIDPGSCVPAGRGWADRPVRRSRADPTGGSTH